MPILILVGGWIVASALLLWANKCVFNYDYDSNIIEED